DPHQRRLFEVWSPTNLRKGEGQMGKKKNRRQRVRPKAPFALRQTRDGRDRNRSHCSTLCLSSACRSPSAKLWLVPDSGLLILFPGSPPAYTCRRAARPTARGR